MPALLAVLTPGVRSQVQVNRQVVALPYMKSELHVYQSGINYMVEISELGALITYNGLSFSIRLPYHLFGNNTKGQCGEPLGPCGLPAALRRAAQAVGEAGCEHLPAQRWFSGSPARGPVGRGQRESCLVCALSPGLMVTGGPGLEKGGCGAWCWCDVGFLPTQARAPTTPRTTACCPVGRSLPAASSQRISGW